MNGKFNFELPGVCGVLNQVLIFNSFCCCCCCCLCVCVYLRDRDIFCLVFFRRTQMLLRHCIGKGTGWVVIQILLISVDNCIISTHITGTFNLQGSEAVLQPSQGSLLPWTQPWHTLLWKDTDRLKCSHNHGSSAPLPTKPDLGMTNRQSYPSGMSGKDYPSQDARLLPLDPQIPATLGKLKLP